MNRINLSESELVALAARIQRNYSYDPERGLLVNRKTGRAVKGMRQGRMPYVQLDINFFGRRTVIGMHRAVWAWHHGRFPEKQIDHVNGVETDNRIENLREVTPSENMRNMVYPWKPNAKTGLPGVNEHGNGYRIKVAQNRYYFRDKYEAFYHLTLLGRRYK